jgi:predicted PurR-regulated permease PerM
LLLLQKLVGEWEVSRNFLSREFMHAVLICVLVVATLVVLWLLSDLLLILFAAILIAIVLRAIADPISSTLRVGEAWGLLAAGLLVVGVVGGTLYLFGSELAAQLQSLSDLLSPALSRLATDLHLGSWADVLNGARSATGGVGNMVTRLLSWSTTVLGSLASLAIAVWGGIYLAVAPGVYLAGFLKLVPPSLHDQAALTLDDCGNALRRWMQAQLLAMAAVGTMTTFGLIAVGVPSPLALGLIAGVAESVPYLGPIAAAVPALVVASSQDWQTVGWTLALYVFVQSLESNLIMPMLASRSVAIAPAVAIFSITAMGILFGPLGLLLGFPLTVVLDVAVRRLYVRDLLGEPVEILGEPVREPGDERKDKDPARRPSEPGR